MISYLPHKLTTTDRKKVTALLLTLLKLHEISHFSSLSSSIIPHLPLTLSVTRTNQAKKGGVCIKHGAEKKQCSTEGCTNKAQKGGVCVKHGATKKRCSREGCTNQAQIGEVYIRHGAKMKRCNREGCTNKAIHGGVCMKHGAKMKRCSSDG